MENEKHEKCDACGFETEELKFYKNGMGFPEGSGRWLCELCVYTFSGNARQYPEQYPYRDVMFTVAACSNMIIKEVRQAAQKNGEVKPSASHNTSSPKLPGTLLNFMCYLVDNCEGETITEEYLLQVGSDFIKR